VALELPFGADDGGAWLQQYGEYCYLGSDWSDDGSLGVEIR